MSMATSPFAWVPICQPASCALCANEYSSSSSVTIMPKSFGRPTYGCDSRAVRSEIEPSQVAFMPPTRTHSSPKPVRTPAAIMRSRCVVADHAVDARREFTGLARVLVGAQVVRRAVGVGDEVTPARANICVISLTAARSSSRLVVPKAGIVSRRSPRPLEQAAGQLARFRVADELAALGIRRLFVDAGFLRARGN